MLRCSVISRARGLTRRGAPQFDGVGGNAVALIDFNRGAQVVANEMRHLGENGVVLIGATEWVDGRAGTQPRRSTVAGNLIHHVGLYTKQSCAVLSAVALG